MYKSVHQNTARLPVPCLSRVLGYFRKIKDKTFVFLLLGSRTIGIAPDSGFFPVNVPVNVEGTKNIE
jgi:hypothetical protein